jgi:2-polyprenyl-6-methoxyphenol hydroxylase-like FAD-dependent oxidoreductase
MEVAIIGGGIGGLTAALALHQQGVDCRIRVYENVREIRPLGVGINLLPHAVRELTELGLQQALYAALVEPKEFGFFTHHGQLIYREPCGLAAGYKYPHFSAHRGDLHLVLYEAVQQRLPADTVVLGHRCTGVEETADGVTIHFADAPPRKADLAIGADGISSVVRRQLHPGEGPPVFSGVNIWRGVTRAKPYLTGGTICRIGGIFTTNKAVVYPIRNDIDGHGAQLINWAVEVFTKEQGAVDWNKPGRLEDFFHHFKDWHFDWLDVAELMQKSEFLFTYPMVDRDPLGRWTFGRVSLLGDAAHPMYPRGGNGGAQAILDAVAFARHVKNGGSAKSILQAYEDERLPLANRVVLQSRNAPPDVIIDEVERRTGGKPFQNIDEVMSREEILKVQEKYKQVSGSDLDSVGRRSR